MENDGTMHAAGKIHRLKSCLNPDLTEAGCDEAGRGCLAGPVFAAAVILPRRFNHPLLNDSKKLSPAQRTVMRKIIEEYAIDFGIGMMEADVIDQINILQASILAMHNALDNLHALPQMILVDGNRFRPYRNIPHRCIVGGDWLYRSIAAASILAKTYRDDYMTIIDSRYPCYGWKVNKGYPTPSHRQAIRTYGITPFHRRSFRQLNDQLSFDFKESGPDH